MGLRAAGAAVGDALGDGEAGFQLLAEHLPDVSVLTFDHDLRVRIATGAALRAHGWTSQQLVGVSVLELTAPPAAAALAEACRAALAGQRRRLELPGRHRLPGPHDTSRVWAVDLVPLRGAAAGAMLIARDVTELRRADEERRLLLGRLYEAQESQDRRLAADLHDSHVQSLTAIGLRLEQARRRLGTDRPDVLDLLSQVGDDLTAEIASLRRTIGRLRPLALDQDGLDAALRSQARTARAQAALASCEVTASLGGERLDPAVETALFRVAQQALANLVEHAGARHASVTLECRDGGVLLRVEDDGRGFDLDAVRARPGGSSFGLIAMRERVEALGGHFTLRTGHGRGTRIEARVPLAGSGSQP
jgi:PAS domain S-box-containing protein